MNNKKAKKLILAMSLLLVLTACNKAMDEDRVIIKEPGKTITIIDDKDNEAGEAVISVVKIDRYENMSITDWLNENTVIVSRENTTLEKMSLSELANAHPRSLYLFNLDNKEYKLLKEKSNTHLGEATLSADKKNLLYYEYTLGDPAFSVMNMDTLKDFSIRGPNIAGAMSAKWGDNETVVGADYSGGAYLAHISGKITSIEGLKGKALVIVEQIKDKIYYNTNSDGSLWRLDLATKETVDLNLKNIYRVFPSPDENQMLLIQGSGAKQSLLLCDTNGGNRKTIAEGNEISGVSWSGDQRLIAYNMKTDMNGNTVNGLYIYDTLKGEATQVAVGVQYLSTSWSPSSEALAYAEWDGSKYDSSIIYLEYTLRK
ncbi:TolB family protein [Geosporobacter ferrireducens]|uniref:TolB family protein n=1 Tax=Geosporobacter ferrireducens TaxID=1424294 RepID=UPI00139B63AD|nr:hypothetical protein [Geosporobacter ferrireducens]MTI56629.1 hypothetical protein [Geosporobacter ferrireducens]